MNGSKDKEWDWLGVYLFRKDGTYSRAKWIRGPDQLKKILPKIRRHVEKGLEVRITNSLDEMLFFYTRESGIEWDGIGLTRLMPTSAKA
jgi:hypothetical protein